MSDNKKCNCHIIVIGQEDIVQKNRNIFDCIARVKPSFFREKMSAIFFLIQNTALELDQDNGKGKKKMSFAYLQVCQKASQIQ